MNSHPGYAHGQGLQNIQVLQQQQPRRIVGLDGSGRSFAHPQALDSNPIPPVYGGNSFGYQQAPAALPTGHPSTSALPPPPPQQPNGTYPWLQSSDDTRSLSATPVTEAPSQPPFNLAAELDKCIERGVIDSWRVGHAIYTQYIHYLPDTDAIVAKFVKKAAGVAQSVKMPIGITLFDVTNSLIMSFASLVITQIPLGRLQSTEPAAFDHEKIVANPNNVTTERRCPTTASFNGSVIEVKHLKTRKQKNHVALQHNLMAVLRKSVTDFSEFKTTWLLPNDQYSKDPNAKEFPEEFYHGLEGTFLEYYGLNDEALRKTVYSDEDRNISCLRGVPESEKKKRFKTLSRARSAYESKVFPRALKNAFRELSKATPSKTNPNRLIMRSHKRKCEEPRQVTTGPPVEEPTSKRSPTQHSPDSDDIPGPSPPISTVTDNFSDHHSDDSGSDSGQ